MPAFPLSVTQRRVAAALLVGVLALVLVWKHLGHGGAGTASLRVAPINAAPIVPRTGSSTVAVARPVVVDVVGAVRRPGLYRLAQGDRVADAIARAGGLTRRAERTAVNLAAPVADGEQVVVAARGSPLSGASSGSPAPGAPVSLSSATADQLDGLPGVGPVTAQKIVDYRQQHGPFRSVDELDAIPGIGPARLHELQGLVMP